MHMNYELLKSLRSGVKVKLDEDFCATAVASLALQTVCVPVLVDRETSERTTESPHF